MSVRLLSARRSALEMSDDCLLSQWEPFSCSEGRLVPTWPARPETPSTVVKCRMSYSKGMQIVSPRSNVWDGISPLSPVTIIIPALDTRLIREGIRKKWPIHMCSEESLLCNPSSSFKKVLSRSPPARSVETRCCWRRTTSFLPAGAAFCLAAGASAGKWEQPESDSRQQPRRASVGPVLVSQHAYLRWPCVLPQHRQRSLASCVPPALLTD